MGPARTPKHPRDPRSIALTATEPTSNEDARLAARQEAKREIIEFITMVLWLLLLFLVLRKFVIEGYEVQGPSMEPSLRDRERILVFKLPHLLSQFALFEDLESIKERDVVVFQSPDDPDKRYVKRVIAKGPKPQRRKMVDAQQNGASVPPTDSVSVLYQDGHVYVNNNRIDEPYAVGGGNLHGQERVTEVRLGSGEYYVLGDNRNVSRDSRSFGRVADDRIIGKAILRFWPLNRLGLVQ